MVQAAQIEAILGHDSTLSDVIPGFRPRAIQLALALEISQCLQDNSVLLAEAGTGTGKTYAYLIPSLLSGKKIIISTGTKNLQDQLFHRDLPLIRNALGTPTKIAILKGRSNYLCKYRLNTHAQSTFISPDTLNNLYKIKRWSESSPEGEIEHITTMKLDQSLIPLVTSTAENCLGQECDFFANCFLIKARRRAQEADLLVVNHHLFFADSQLKESGVLDFLPDFDGIIFDEAHQLHEIATHFLGESLSGRQLHYLARDIQAQQQVEAPDMAELRWEAEELILTTKTLSQAFGPFTRGSWEKIIYKPEIKTGITSIRGNLQKLEASLVVAAVRGKGLENCLNRIKEISLKFSRLTELSSKENIHWYEVQEKNFSIHHTPLYIAKFFEKLINDSEKAWVFTSATLSVEGDFSYFQSLLGLKQATKLALDSPFDYRQQAILYLPQITIMPNDSRYVSQMLDYIIPVLKMTKGRAFLLFTSHRVLQEVASQLPRYIHYPLIVQGYAPKSQLLTQFNNTDNAILLGTNSFWEGVDVKGSRLSCVIIDKIPFLSPDEPILKTRLDQYRKEGKNPFTDYQLPQAVIMLRQGAGRLIRDKADKGILMLCDPRLRERDYGKMFLASLPPMKLANSLDEIENFLQENQSESIST